MIDITESAALVQEGMAQAKCPLSPEQSAILLIMMGVIVAKAEGPNIAEDWRSTSVNALAQCLHNVTHEESIRACFVIMAKRIEEDETHETVVPGIFGAAVPGVSAAMVAELFRQAARMAEESKQYVHQDAPTVQ